LDEKYHDAEPMVAISVIENEITYLESRCKSMNPSDDREYFEAKLEIL
jgi:hypothetical protein